MTREFAPDERFEPNRVGLDVETHRPIARSERLAGSGARFQTGRDLARFMLEGLARSTLTYDQDERTERLLAAIKRITRVMNRKGSVQEIWED